MQTQTREEINDAAGKMRSFMAANEALAAEGKQDSDEYRANETAADRAYDTWDASRRRGELEDKNEQIERWSKDARPNNPSPLALEYAARARENGDRTATPEYNSAFRHYIRHFGGWAKDPDNYQHDPMSEFRTLSIVQDTAGGYTVPADVRADLLARLPALSEVLKYAEIVPTSRDLIQWPRVQPKNNSGSGGSDGLGSIYTSSFVGTMTGEVPATGTGNNEPSWGMFEIPIKRARSESRPSMDLASDTEFDLLSFLTKDGALNMALLRESQIIAGTGIGSNVAGVMSGRYDGGTSAASVTQNQIQQVDISGTTTHTISNSLTDLGSANKILDLVYAVPRQYRQLASFSIVGSSLTFKAIRKLTDAVGRYIWQPGFAGMQPDFEGARVVMSEFAPQDANNGGATDNDVLLVGALEMLIVGVRTNTTPQVLLERFADTDQIGLVLRQRFGGGISNTDAFRLGYVHS